MPYGLSKDIGGDSLANTASMESCVQKVMKQGHSKESAIRICKSSIQDSRKSKQRRGR